MVDTSFFTDNEKQEQKIQSILKDFFTEKNANTNLTLKPLTTPYHFITTLFTNTDSEKDFYRLEMTCIGFKVRRFEIMYFTTATNPASYTSIYKTDHPERMLLPDFREWFSNQLRIVFKMIKEKEGI